MREMAQARLIGVESYRHQANRLRLEADNIHDLTMRNELRDIARKYEALADGVERMLEHLAIHPLRRTGR
jgi:hypothetical protein